MTLHELSRPAATSHAKAPRLASILRRLADLWWFGVRSHVADLHGLPRPAEPARPDQNWPFGHM